VDGKLSPHNAAYETPRLLKLANWPDDFHCKEGQWHIRWRETLHINS
jgi:hypothetical protein